MAGTLLQRRRDFRRRSALEAKTVPCGLDRFEVSRSSTVSPTSSILPSVSRSQTQRQPGELTSHRPQAFLPPHEASPKTTVSRRPSQTPTQPNQSRSPKPPASPPPLEASRKTTMSQSPATAEYKQVFKRAGIETRPRRMSLGLHGRNTDTQHPLRAPQCSVAKPDADAALVITGAEASVVSTDLCSGHLQNIKLHNASRRETGAPCCESLQGVAWKHMPRRASTEGRFYVKPIGVKPDACQEFSPSFEKNHSSGKKVSAVRIEASRLLHFCFSGETRPVSEKGWDMKSCHRDVRAVKNQLDVLDQLLDRLTWKLSNIPDEIWQFVKEGRQSSCHYRMEHFVDEAMQKFRERFRHLTSRSNFTYWEDWATALFEGSEDQFLSRLVHKITLQIGYRNTSFTRDDIIRLLWPYASSEEIETLKQLSPVAMQRLLRLPTPPVADPSEYDDLCLLFQSMDDNNFGEISFEVVAKNGFFDPDQKNRMCQLWDIDGNGLMSKLEFCQMMCTSGFRATEESTIATLFDGKRVLRDPDDGTWYLEEQGGLGGTTTDSLPAAVADQQTYEIPRDPVVMGG